MVHAVSLTPVQKKIDVRPDERWFR